jgi:hypothetical protein
LSEIFWSANRHGVLKCGGKRSTALDVRQTEKFVADLNFYSS